jgi:chemotaxis protein MotA
MPGQSSAGPAKRGRADLISAGGLALALAGILGGLVLEGGNLRDVAQFTALLIVFGGTAGAVMVSTPGPVLKRALARAAGVFHDSAPPLDGLLAELIAYSAKARKTGLVSLEDDTDQMTDPFLRKAVILAVDGTDLQEIRAVMELEMMLAEQQAESEAKVFESAGGYAPTIGIIGAVLGLIQVMKNLANIDEVGHGIAVAFVATVYGVGSANLLFLPAASKIKARAHAETRRREMILEGVSGIVEGLNPKLIQSRLAAFLTIEAAPKPKVVKPARAATGVAEA